MDNILLITVLMIFLSAFVGTVIRYRARDKCLKSFRRFLVTLEFMDHRQVWGELDVYHNGVMLEYDTPYLDKDGSHFETSYILYQDQFNTMFGLKRLHDELSPENQARREREIARTYHPNLFRRFWRRLANVCNLLRDAFTQALNAFIGSIKKTGSSQFVATQDARLTSTAQQLIGQAAAYEPMLEKYIGHKVVLEVMRDNKKEEYCGILKDYSSSFVTLLDVPVTDPQEYRLAAAGQLKINRNLDFTVHVGAGAREEMLDLEITVKNKGAHGVHLCHAEGQDYARQIDLDLAPGAEQTFALTDIPRPNPPKDTGDAPSSLAPDFMPDVRLWIQAEQYMDLIIPRSVGAIRHGAESIGGSKIRIFG